MNVPVEVTDEATIAKAKTNTNFEVSEGEKAEPAEEDAQEHDEPDEREDKHPHRPKRKR